MTNKVMPWFMIIALLVSQSYAYAFIPCESNGFTNAQHDKHMDSNSLVPNSLVPMQYNQVVHDMAEHKQHNMQQDMQQETQQETLQETQYQNTSMQCCDQDCSCLTGTCASITLIHSVHATVLNVVPDSAGFYLFILQDAFLPSFLKPPIIS
jgi:hypothetical protein